LGIESHLDRVCNRLMCTTEMLMGKSSEYLLRNLAVNLFPETSGLADQFTERPTHLINPQLGIYVDVVNMRYDNIYLDIMLRQKDTRISEIAAHLVEAPPPLIHRAFFSVYNDAFNACNLELATFVDSMKAKGLFAVDNYTMRFKGRPTGPETVGLIGIQDMKVFAQVDAYSFMYIDDKNELHVQGRSKMASIDFPYMADAVRDYLLYVVAMPFMAPALVNLATGMPSGGSSNSPSAEVADTKPPFTFPDIMSIDKKKLMLSTRVYADASKEPYSTLLSQYMQTGAPPVRTWIMVDYVVLPSGVKLLDKNSDLDKMEFNYGWYLSEVRKRLMGLSKMPVVLI